MVCALDTVTLVSLAGHRLFGKVNMNREMIDGGQAASSQPARRIRWNRYAVAFSAATPLALLGAAFYTTTETHVLDWPMWAIPIGFWREWWISGGRIALVNLVIGLALIAANSLAARSAGRRGEAGAPFAKLASYLAVGWLIYFSLFFALHSVSQIAPSAREVFSERHIVELLMHARFQGGGR